MRTNDILIKQLSKSYTGYLLQSISKSHLTLKDILDCQYPKLKTIPHKITYFLHRNKIKEVYKSDCFGGIDNYYLVHTTDGTIFHLEY